MSKFKLPKLRGLLLRIHNDSFASGVLSLFNSEHGSTEVGEFKRLDPREDAAMLASDLDRIRGDFRRAQKKVMWKDVKSE